MNFQTQDLQKHKRVLLPKWLAAANGERCTWPGCPNCMDPRRNTTVVAAHSNMLIHGKGMGRKADDLFIAFLCSDCHHEYDFGKALTKDQKTLYFFMAMSKTWRRLFDLGLLFLPKGMEAEFYEQHPAF